MSSPYPEIAQHLRTVLPARTVLDDAMQLALYAYDGTVYEGRTNLVVLPETTEQVVAVVKAAHAAGVPIVPRGAGTSLSGGPVPVAGGIVVSFSRMDRVLELDYPNQRAVVQPGVINQDLQTLVAPRGYFYAPDPASQAVCTLGGNVGENSGGPHCLKYGVTANHILGVEMVLPNGKVLRTGGKALDWPGYDLPGLIVGHEGTFGLVTEITCRLLPLPERIVTMLAIFDTLEAASRTVSDIIAAGIIPATLEMMDNAMIRAVEAALQAGYPQDAGAVLIIELDGLAAGLQEPVAQVRDLVNRHGATELRVARDEAERTLLWKGRKGAFGAVVNIAPAKLCTDITVPRTKLPETLAAVMAIGERHGVPIANVFHAGDGNLHPLVLFDPRAPGSLEKVAAVDDEIARLAVAQGGSLTGEHGIGCCKRGHMTEMFGAHELRTMARVREAFDPSGRFNPGKVLPEPAALATAPVAETPDTLRALSTLLAEASAGEQRVVLRGHSTKSPAPPEGAVVCSLSGLDRVLHFDHENLTVVAQAGITFPALDAVLATHGQMLPLRPRFRERATLGGALATNDSGPCRLRYGGPRDLVTGVRAVLPGGAVVTFGSACVKNVAGYALEKLLLGSRGTLAALAEVTLRTLPRPEAARTLVLTVATPAALEAFLADLLASPLQPAAVELLNGPAAQLAGLGEGWRLLVGLEGFRAEIAATQARLGELARAHALPAWQVVEDDYTALWARVTDLGQTPGEGQPVLKAAVPLAATAASAADLAGLQADLPLRAAPGLGLLHVALTPETEPASFQHEVQALVLPRGGVTSWLSPTPGRTVTVLSEVTRDLSLRLKNALDPGGVLPPLRV